MLLFHLGDAFFFINELTKSTPTSPEEQVIFTRYLNDKKRLDARYGKAAVIGVTLPYFYQCFMRRGVAWKVAVFYFLLTTINATYDCGMYINFFFHGPKTFKQILSLDQSESFGPIQTRLFLRWCASQEIKKATGEVKKKHTRELVFLRSYRN
jgi:hypothetical protein